ncbi:hypothetical protein ACFYYN_18220 [Streptomyces sp. NPDC001902]
MVRNDWQSRYLVMAAALTCYKNLQGLASFVRTENPTPFQKDDLLLAQEVVSRAVVVVARLLSYASAPGIGASMSTRRSPPCG